jgi:hypothetical protein
MGLELVVPPPVQIVDAHRRLQVRQQLVLRQEIAQLARDHRRAPHAAADQDAVAGLAPALDDLDADVVQLERHPVVLRAGDGDLELAPEEGELGVQARPLADQLGGDPRVLDFLWRDAGIGVRGDVADAVAAGLDGVHLDGGERVEDVGHIAQLWPVELDVLARGEVAIALVPALGDVGERAHLAGRERAIGDGDAQHVGVQLQIEAVHQPQRLELVLGQAAVQPARDLGAELGGALGNETVVELVIAVHGRSPESRQASRFSRPPPEGGGPAGSADAG